MQRSNPWNPYLQAALRRVLPWPVYLRYIGRHENGSLRIWRELAEKVPDDRAILDVGAFHGEYASVACGANTASAIYAFEPNPESCAKLRKSIEGKNISIEAVALASKSGTVSFTCSEATSRIASDGEIEVPAVCLDEWVDRVGCRPALIKIDTEGAEAEVLAGGQRTIREMRPTILCEILSDEAGERVMPLLPTYAFFRIDENGGVEQRPRITREGWRNKNWLFVPVW